MPWTKNNYPDPMQSLTGPVRDKAIEIANALEEQNELPEGKVIATAMSKAKDWGKNHGYKLITDEARKATDGKHHGKNQYVVPTGTRWGVKNEEAGEIHITYSTKNEAIEEARSRAEYNHSELIIQNETGEISEKHSYNN